MGAAAGVYSQARPYSPGHATHWTQAQASSLGQHLAKAMLRSRFVPSEDGEMETIVAWVPGAPASTSYQALQVAKDFVKMQLPLVAPLRLWGASDQLLL